MIDLEEELAQIVDLAPEPPDVAGVTRRARQRRSRRHRGATTAAFLVMIGIGGAIALRPTDGGRRLVLEPAPTESVRVTLLDGSHLEISGPTSLGLEDLEPAFHGELDWSPRFDQPLYSHSFTVVRTAPAEAGRVVGRYPTADGQELVAHETTNGVDAIVQYDHWALVVSSNNAPTDWATFAKGLSAHESADGFLVIDPADSWNLGPTDAPDVQLGGSTYGSGAPFSFFGPKHYPSGCPTAAAATARTPQGWPVSRVNGTWWCDADAHVRVHVGDTDLADAAIRGLRVESQSSGPNTVAQCGAPGSPTDLTAEPTADQGDETVRFMDAAGCPVRLDVLMWREYLPSSHCGAWPAQIVAHTPIGSENPTPENHVVFARDTDDKWRDPASTAGFSANTL